jgi:hypothetical protein
MTKDGAIVTKDTSIEVGNITEEDKLTLDLFLLNKQNHGDIINLDKS